MKQMFLRTSLIVLLIFISGGGVKAQWYANRARAFSYFSFSGGMCIPFGDFSAKIIGSDYRGFAMLGGGVKARLAFPFGKRSGLGITVTGGTTWNPFDAQAYAKAYGERNPGTHVRVRSGPYEVTNLNFGMLSSSDFGTERFHMDYWVTLGVAGGRFPDLTVEIVNQNQRAELTDNDIRFGFRSEFGIAFRYDLTDRLGVMLEGEYTPTLIKYVIQTVETDLFSQNRININAGIAFRIGKLHEPNVSKKENKTEN